MALYLTLYCSTCFTCIISCGRFAFVYKYLFVSHLCHVPRRQSILPYPLISLCQIKAYGQPKNNTWVNQMYPMPEQKIYMPTHSLALSPLLSSSPWEQDVSTCSLNMTPSMRGHEAQQRQIKSSKITENLQTSHNKRKKHNLILESHWDIGQKLTQCHLI